MLILHWVQYSHMDGRHERRRGVFPYTSGRKRNFVCGTRRKLCRSVIKKLWNADSGNKAKVSRSS